MTDTSKIPQFFYDLFARVIPGAYGLLILAWSTNTTVGEILIATLGSAPSTKESASTLFLFVFLVSYILGLALSLLSDGLETVLAKVSPVHFSVLREIALDNQQRFPAYFKTNVEATLKREYRLDPPTASHAQFHAVLILWYDQLRERSADLSQRLTRLRADYRMYGGLARIFT